MLTGNANEILVEFVQGDAESLPFNDASADAGWLVQKYKY